MGCGSKIVVVLLIVLVLAGSYTIYSWTKQALEQYELQQQQQHELALSDSEVMAKQAEALGKQAEALKEDAVTMRVMADQNGELLDENQALQDEIQADQARDARISNGVSAVLGIIGALVVIGVLMALFRRG